MTMRYPNIVVLILLMAISGCQPSSAPPASQRASPPPPPVLFHLPGIAGEMSIDRRLIKGLVEGNVATNAEIIDWTGENRGILALGKLDLNKQQAKLLAERITKIYRDDPRTRIILTAHSGGTGIAVWTLEYLPADAKIDTLLMLAAALSADYDLDKALAHTRRAYSFYSEFDDVVLGLGTRTFGTIDRVKTNAAGYVGFASNNPKLKQFPYDPAWIKIGNAGDHIGTMDDQFAKEVLAPLLRP